MSLVITPVTPPSAREGVAYALTLIATGGIEPYDWELLVASPNSGSWLSIDSATGALTGTPGTAEIEDLLVRVSDSAGRSDTISLVVVVNSSAGTDLSAIARLIDYDALPTSTIPNDEGVVYLDASVIDATNTWSGHKSVRHTIAGPSASNGPFGDASDLTLFPTDPMLKAGDELWVVRTIYVDSTFDFTAGGNLKWLRLADIRNSVSSDAGWLDFYIDDNTGKMRHQNELVPGPFSEDFSAQADSALATLDYHMPKGQWVRLQGYVKLDETAGVVRAWAGDTPIYECLVNPTTVSGARAFYTRFLDYWDSPGLPSGNVGLHMWMSRYAVAVVSAALDRDDRPQLATDSRGNLYIDLT